jgi:hypothetical protein
MEEGEESQFQEPENIFKKIIVENFPNPKKGMSINIQKAYRAQINLDQKRKSSQHIIIETQNLKNEEKNI